jgi:CRISPR-associated protein Cmr1
MAQLQIWIDKLDRIAEKNYLKAEFQVITPMFIGDGDQKAKSIRPPAIKGALRFWWRALNWNRCFEQAGTQTAALNQLHNEEAAIFGLAAKHGCNGAQLGGQGVFTLKVTQKAELMKSWSPGSGTQYLLGQGLWNYRDKLLREAIATGSRFAVELAINSGRLEKAAVDLALDASSIANSIDDALLAFGLLGGLGSRARKGLGAVCVTELHGSRWSVPASAEAYKHVLQQLLEPSVLSSSLPPFSAFSAQSRLDVSCTGSNAMALLEGVGEEMQMYRSWGQAGKVNGKPAEQNFREDHDQALIASRGDKPSKPPQRSVFGLPHNYFFSSTRGKVDIHVKKGPAGERRSSPLCIHPHAFADGSCVLVLLLLPAVFLPGDNPMLEYKSGRNSFTLPVTKVDWDVIARFMDRFNSKETVLATKLQGAHLL